MLNVGDNLLSGTMPSFYTLDGARYRLPDYFTELWLQGNPWDGGPCVALCGANTGPMDAAKRASSKEWAGKCLAEDADTYDDLPATGFTVDALGRCTYKSAKCGEGQRYVTRRTVVDPDCTRCPINTYHDDPDAGHEETECKPQITCNAGEKIVGDEQDLRTVKRECEPCTTGKYQSASNHRSTVCLDQTTCGAGQEIDADTTTARRKCTTCLAGKYQTATDHQHEACEDQPQCKRGESFENTVAKRRQCTPCPANTYQDSADAAALQAVCIAQPACAQGQKITGTDSRIDRRTCAACKPGEYQDEERHRETECKEQPACNVGEEFGIDTSKRRQCIPCGPNEYQDQDSADEDLLQAVCTPQPTCAPGQFVSPDSATSRRTCEPCPKDTYQDKSDHRETRCKEQPTCGPGEKFTTSFTERRQCSECGPDQYQGSSDSSALQTECIDQPYCGRGQYMTPYSKTAKRTCKDCLQTPDHPFDTFQSQSQHRETQCTVQPTCQPGTRYKASLVEERTCEPCVAGTYQETAGHTSAVCNPQQPCLAGYGFVGDSTSPGKCVACKEGTVQPKTNHFEECRDKDAEAPTTTECNNGGKLDSDGRCDCDSSITGFAGTTCAEFSKETTCNGFGTVGYDAATGLASCSNCDDPAEAVGEWCQYSNIKTCKGYGVVDVAGRCEWRAEGGKSIVPKCDPGYYYNPTSSAAPTTQDLEEAIISDDAGCFPCSPGQFAPGTARRVECDACPTTKVESAAGDGTLLDMLQTSEPASTSATDCFPKFESAPPDRPFCYDTSITSGKPLSRITSGDDCSVAAESLGFTFVGEFVVPSPGCVYDEQHQEARFYVRFGLDAAAKQDTPLCKNFVCTDPKNDVTPLTDDPANADAEPSCRVSATQTREAVAFEKIQAQTKVVPAMLSLGGATLVGSYYYQYRTKDDFDWMNIWMHIHVWLICLRVVDMMSDFAFYAISLRGVTQDGGAFLEQYGDGNPDTNPFKEPKVAAFLFASIFFSTLGLFLMPLDIWVVGQRAAGATLSLFSLVVMVAMTVFEDIPQIVLVLIYMRVMQGMKATDAVAVLSLLASMASVVFNGAAVYTHAKKLREEDPSGWWRRSVLATDEENSELRKEITLLRRRDPVAAQMTNPMFTMQAGDQVQETLEPASGGSKKREEEMFGGFEQDTADLCESEEKTGKKCTKKKAKKSAYCAKHTCTEKQCYRLKSSKAEYCNVHVGTDL